MEDISFRLVARVDCNAVDYEPSPPYSTLNTTSMTMTTTREILIVPDWDRNGLSPENSTFGGCTMSTAIHINYFALTSGMRKEKLNHNNKEQNKLLITLTVYA